MHRPSSSSVPSTSKPVAGRNLPSDKTLSLVKPFPRKKSKCDNDSKRTPPPKKRQRKEYFPEGFTDPMRFKYSERELSKFKPVKEPNMKAFDAFAKWMLTGKYEGKVMEFARLRTCDTRTDFFKTLSALGKWLRDEVS